MNWVPLPGGQLSVHCLHCYDNGLYRMGYFAALFSDKMEKVNAVMSGGNELLVPILGTGALIGVYASLTMDRLYPFKNLGFAVLSSAALMFLIQSYNKKANKQWLKEWGLTICMVFGMICATVSEQFIML